MRTLPCGTFFVSIYCRVACRHSSPLVLLLLVLLVRMLAPIDAHGGDTVDLLMAVVVLCRATTWALSGFLSAAFLTGSFFILRKLSPLGIIAAIFVALVNAVLPLVIRVLTLSIGQSTQRLVPVCTVWLVLFLCFYLFAASVHSFSRRLVSWP